MRFKWTALVLGGSSPRVVCPLSRRCRARQGLERHESKEDLESGKAGDDSEGFFGTLSTLPEIIIHGSGVHHLLWYSRIHDHWSVCLKDQNFRCLAVPDTHRIRGVRSPLQRLNDSQRDTEKPGLVISSKVLNFGLFTSDPCS